jgi:excinuclease UvrABC ATPase subunit
MTKKKVKTATKDEVVATAKNLYLSIDEQGNHKVSLQQIATELQQQYGDNYNRSTISRWAKKEGWDEIFENGRKLGISKKIQEKVLQGKEIDEAYTEEIGKVYARYYDVENAIYANAAKILTMKLEKEIQELEKNPEKIQKINTQEISGLKENSFRNLRLMTGQPTDSTEIRTEKGWNLSALSDEELDTLEKLRRKSTLSGGDRED